MSSSSSSSMDSTSNHRPPPTSAASSLSNRECQARRDLNTDLRLGLSISPPNSDISSATNQIRGRKLDWPPIKPLLRIALAGKSESRRRDSLFVKVYMEGIPIGRKLDLFAHGGYDSLISTLGEMFKATIYWPGDTNQYEKNHHVLTYEDKEGDWMMIGDVPWEMFLSTVKRLKITRASGC